MAERDGDPSARMTTEEQGSAERIFYEAIFHYFKRHKVEISSAIRKSFPFLEGLRDRELITNKLFEDSQESCRNLVPVPRVVYNVLCELEKNFNLELLEALFSEVNMQEYPDLIRVHKSFENEVRALCSQEDSGEEREDRLEQGSGENSSPRRLTWPRSDPSSYNGVNLPENELSEHNCEAEQRNVNSREMASDQNGAPRCHQASEQCAGPAEPAESCERVAFPMDQGEASVETPSPLTPSPLIPSPLPCSGEGASLSSPGIHMPSCSVRLVDIKKEKPFFCMEVEQGARARKNHRQPSEVIVISSEDSDTEEPAAASSSALRSHPVINNHDPVDSRDGEEAQEATCSRRQRTPEPVDFRDSSTFRKIVRKRVRGHDHSSSESSEEEMPPAPWTSALRGSVSMSTWRIHSQRQRLSSDSSLELSHGEEPQEALRSGSGSGQQETGNEKCSCVVCSPESVPRGQEAMMKSGRGSHLRDTMDVGNSSTLGKGSGERSFQYHPSKTPATPDCRLGPDQGRKRVNSRPLKRDGKRGPRIPREKNVNFDLPKLPVTCGEAKGTLFKKKLKKGVQKRSIKTEDGKWFTPREFEIQGNHAASKNWRLSVRCHGWPLRELIERRLLPNPPPTRKKKKALKSHKNVLVGPPVSTSSQLVPGTAQTFAQQKKANKCHVCLQGELLILCDTCARSYHQNCHIPPVEAQRNQWSCILCRTKAWETNQRSQPRHLESEVLKRPMLPEEQLKCARILLRVYSHPKSAFFVPEPHNNHKFITLVLNIEDLFEKDFKNIFSIQEASKSVRQFEPIILLT